MDDDITTPQSEVDEQFETPHEFCSSHENGTCPHSAAASESTPDAVSSQETCSSEEKSTHEELNYVDQNNKLEERLKGLKKLMSNLKEQLCEEKIAWKKEIDEAVKLAKSVGVSYCTNNDYEYPKEIATKPEIDLESMISEPTLSEIAILDYEQKLATYQEALTKAHAEKRNLLKRQLAVNAYKRRLLEVENLCNMELMKVKQSVQFLQPLQALASTWDMPIAENMTKFDSELTGKISKTSSQSPNVNSDERKPDFVTAEDLENKLFNDFKEITSQISPLTSNHATCNSVLNDDDELMKNKMNWYNNELGPHSPFNPLM